VGQAPCSLSSLSALDVISFFFFESRSALRSFNHCKCTSHPLGRSQHAVNLEATDITCILPQHAPSITDLMIIPSCGALRTHVSSSIYGSTVRHALSITRGLTPLCKQHRFFLHVKTYSPLLYVRYNTQRTLLPLTGPNPGLFPAYLYISYSQSHLNFCYNLFPAPQSLCLLHVHAALD
jgi:hypothetical protein